MKSLPLLALMFLPSVMTAQTLNVASGNVVYQFPAAQVGDMPYSDGKTLEILGKSIDLTSVDSIYINNASVIDNTVAVAYAGEKAYVTVAGNIAKDITATVNGAHVVLLQGAGVSKEITYTLSGTSQKGSLYMNGSLKATFILNGLSLTNPDSAAINIRDGKRIAIQLADGTTNSLVDGTSGSQKACFAIKGHAEFSGGGTLNVTGNTKHAIWSKEYIQVKASVGTINILKAVSDGINCNQYYQQNGGTVAISGVGDDGIQVSYETDDDDNKVVDEENTAQLIVRGGTLKVNVTGLATKGLNAEGDIIVNSEKSVPVITVSSTGNGTWDSDDSEAKASACIKSDANVTIADGTLTLTSTGTGGKCIKCDSVLTVTGGTITAKSTGAVYTYGSSSYYSSRKQAPGGPGGGGWPGGGGGGGWPGGGGGGGNTSSSNKCSPKALKSTGNMVFSGGTIDATSTNSEAIESKSCITIEGDAVVKGYAGDDVINSASHMYIKGGTVTVYSTGNDGLDANGNIYISGGHTIAYGTRSPECGIDANEEQNYTVYFTGGELIAIGGGNSVPGNSSSTQCYVTTSGSVSANTSVALSNGSTTLATFTMPYAYSNGSILVTAPGMTKGSSYTLKLGSTSKTVSAVQYSSGSRW